METTAKRSRRYRRGFTLPLVAVAIVVLLFTGLGFLRLGFAAQLRAVRTIQELSARAAADSGLTKALFEMNGSLNVEHWNFNKLPSSGYDVLSNTNANYAYEVQEEDLGYRIVSTGSCGRAKKTVSAIVRRQGLFDEALFATGYAHPKHPKDIPDLHKPPKKGGKLEIDGYNVDSYSSDPKIMSTGNLQIRTNSIHKEPVRLKKNITIDGDVAVGPGGKPEKAIKKDPGVVVTGNEYAAVEQYTLLPVTVPQNLENRKPQKYSYKPNKAISGTVKYSDLKIPKDKTQEINGNCTIYVEGDFKIEKGAELIIPQNASLTLYVAGKIDVKLDANGEEEGLEMGGLINQTQDPTKLTIYGTDTCSKIKLETNENNFYAAVYAPYTKVEVKGTANIYGAFVGWDVKLKNNGTGQNSTFYYDEALLAQGTVRFVTVGWRDE
jgi:hypothetical protein